MVILVAVVSLFDTMKMVFAAFWSISVARLFDATVPDEFRFRPDVKAIPALPFNSAGRYVGLVLAND
jgi:hypothetical protein